MLLTLTRRPKRLFQEGRFPLAVGNEASISVELHQHLHLPSVEEHSIPPRLRANVFWGWLLSHVNHSSVHSSITSSELDLRKKISCLPLCWLFDFISCQQGPSMSMLNISYFFFRILLAPGELSERHWLGWIANSEEGKFPYIQTLYIYISKLPWRRFS